MIVFPLSLQQSLGEDGLRQVLLHEAQHVRRYDDCINLLQKIAVALFPLSPALLWMERRLCLERELACDDAVLRVTGTPKAYALCLTRIAESRLRNRWAHLSVAAFGRPSELSRRIHRILQWPPRQASHFAACTVPAVLLVGIAAGSVLLERFGLPISVDAAPGAIASAELPSAPVHSAQAVPVSHPAKAGVVLANYSLPWHSVPVRGAAHVSFPKHRYPGTRSQTKQGAVVRVGGRKTRTSTPKHDPGDWLFTSQSATRWIQRIQHVPVPHDSEMTPALQEISLPYALIPAGNGWLIVQL